MLPYSRVVMPTCTTASTVPIFLLVTLDTVKIPTGSTGARTYTANWDAAYYPTVNPDPDDSQWHYGTFYYGGGKYQLPDGVYAYTASVEGDKMVMHKIANPGDILPGSTAVILKANEPIASITDRLIRLPYMELGDPITITAANDLRGVDADSVVNKLKAYIRIPNASASAPARLRFVFTETEEPQLPTAVDNTSY